MCIAANKVGGVRAAPCHDSITAEMSRRHNDANVLCLSADLLGEELIDRMVEIWLETEFEGGRHARRVEKIARLRGRALTACMLNGSALTQARSASEAQCLAWRFGLVSRALPRIQARRASEAQFPLARWACIELPRVEDKWEMITRSLPSGGRRPGSA